MRTPIQLLVVVAFIPGCTPAQRLGELAKTATLGTTAVVAEGIVNGLFDDDEEPFEKERRREEEQRWKEYWRANPDLNPAMTEAFAGE